MTAQQTEKMWAELARYYDVLYQWKDYRTEAQRIRELIEKHGRSPGRALLDVGCGTGAHDVFLGQDFDVTGVDVNPAMLAVARRKVPEGKFLRGDMVSFDLGRTFDAVVCLFGAIAYARTYGNLRKAVSCMVRHLKPGGVLIIEPFLTREVYRVGGIHGLTMDGEGVKITRHNVSRRRRDLAVLDFHFLISTKQGTKHVRDVHELALFDPDKSLAILRDAGLKTRYMKNGLMRDRGLFVSVRPA